MPIFWFVRVFFLLSGFWKPAMVRHGSQSGWLRCLHCATSKKPNRVDVGANIKNSLYVIEKFDSFSMWSKRHWRDADINRGEDDGQYRSQGRVDDRGCDSVRALFFSRSGVQDRNHSWLVNSPFPFTQLSPLFICWSDEGPSLPYPTHGRLARIRNLGFSVKIECVCKEWQHRLGHAPSRWGLLHASCSDLKVPKNYDSKTLIKRHNQRSNQETVLRSAIQYICAHIERLLS